MPECGPSVEAKITDGPMKYRSVVTSAPGTVIHTECAEVNVMSLGSAKYFVVFIDEASAHACSAHLNSKGYAASHLQEFVK